MNESMKDSQTLRKKWQIHGRTKPRSPTAHLDYLCDVYLTPKFSQLHTHDPSAPYVRINDVIAGAFNKKGSLSLNERQFSPICVCI